MGYRQFLDFAPGGSPGAFRTNYACVVDRVVRGVGWIGHVIQGTGGMRNVNHSTVLHNIVPVLSLSRGRGPSINNRRPGTNIYHKGRVGWCAVKNVVKVVVNVINFRRPRQGDLQYSKLCASMSSWIPWSSGLIFSNAHFLLSTDLARNLKILNFVIS